MSAAAGAGQRGRGAEAVLEALDVLLNWKRRDTVLDQITIDATAALATLRKVMEGEEQADV